MSDHNKVTIRAKSEVKLKTSEYSMTWVFTKGQSLGVAIEHLVTAYLDWNPGAEDDLKAFINSTVTARDA